MWRGKFDSNYELYLNYYNYFTPIALPKDNMEFTLINAVTTTKVKLIYN